MFNRKTTVTVLLAVMALLVLAEAAEAMPMFARKYRTSCVTCHETFPRRNATGQAFRLNGFRFEDDDTYTKEPPVELGDEAYQRLWPKSVWPTDIPMNFPVSFSSRFLIETDLDGTRTNSLVFLLPEEMELVWAGTMGNNISFYGDIIYLQKDFGGNQTQSWITLKGWVEFQNLIGDDYGLNLRIGTVGTQTMGLYTARDGNNFTTHFYQYTTWMMPDVDLAEAGLTDFRGNWFSIAPQMGLELNGRGHRWTYALGLVTGNSKVPGNEPPEGDVVFTGSARNVDSKDLYGLLAYKIGGLPLDGRNPVDTETSPLEAKSDFWRDDSLLLSAWGYWGKARIMGQVGTETPWKSTDDFWRAGAGFLQKYGDFSLGGGVMFGRNENPYGQLTDFSVDSRTWFGETLCFAYPWLIPFLRYEGMTLDMPQGVPGIVEDFKSQRILPGVKAMIRPNISLTLEVPLYFEGAELEEGFDRSLFMLLSMAF